MSSVQGQGGGVMTAVDACRYLEEEVGSVVCLWILACLLSFSLSAVCTSAGMSGDVWLIFMAASRSLTVLRLFAAAAATTAGGCCFFSTSGALHSPTGGGLGGGGASGKPTRRPFSAWADRALLLQMGQHSFQKTKRETTNRARPQKPTTTARRLIEMSTGNHGETSGGGQRRKGGGGHNEKKGKERGRRGTKYDRQTCKGEREHRRESEL